MNHALYKITNKLNGKQYIGATKSIERRTDEHKKGHTGAKLVKAAIAKYGIDNIEFQTLCIGSKEYIAELEGKVIVAWNTLAPNGYNLQRGGLSPNPVAPFYNPGRKDKKNGDKQKQAVSKALKGVPKDYDVWNKGKETPQATKDKIGDANRGHKWNDEQRANLSKVRKIQFGTQEYKDAQSIRMKKMWAERKARLALEANTTINKEASNGHDF